MRACIHSIERNKLIRVPAGRHVIIPSFAGMASHALDSDGPWGDLIEFEPRKVYSIVTLEGWLEIENWQEGQTGKFTIGKA